HRREYLHVPNGMEPKALGNPFSHHPQELGLALLGTVGRNDVEVTGTILPHQRHLPLIDAVGIDDDLRRRRLAENFGKSYRGYALGRNDLSEHCPWTDGGELLDITDKEDGRVLWNRPEELRHQDHIDHRDLVHDDQVRPERIRMGMDKAHRSGIKLQQPVDGL